MIEAISDLPKGVTGLRAIGRVNRKDCRSVLRPIIEDAARAQGRVRLLWEVTPTPTAPTLGAAVEELQLALRHAGKVSRCAVVSDSKAARTWVTRASQLLPGVFRAFPQHDREAAIAWLGEIPQTQAATLEYRAGPDVAILRPQARLDEQDGDALWAALEPWFARGGEMHGIVLHCLEAPRFHSFGSLLRHLQLMRFVQQRVKRIAIVTDAPRAGQVMPLLQGLLNPKLRHFSGEELTEAVAWAGHPAWSGEVVPLQSQRVDQVDEAGLESFPASDPPPSYSP